MSWPRVVALGLARRWVLGFCVPASVTVILRAALA